MEFQNIGISSNPKSEVSKGLGNLQAILLLTLLCFFEVVIVVMAVVPREPDAVAGNGVPADGNGALIPVNPEQWKSISPLLASKVV